MAALTAELVGKSVSCVFKAHTVRVRLEDSANSPHFTAGDIGKVSSIIKEQTAPGKTTCKFFAIVKFSDSEFAIDTSDVRIVSI